MQVLVTGGAGFLGSHVTEALLSDGHDVVVVDDFSSGSEKRLDEAKKIATQAGRKLEIRKGSLALAETWKTLPPVQALLHAAGRRSIEESIRDPQEDFRSHVAPLPHLIAWLRERKIRMAVYLNSADVIYGDAIAYPCDERSLPSPQSPYAASRAFGELYLMATARALKATGEWSSEPKAANYFSWISLRLGTVYGPRQTARGTSTLIPNLLEELVQGKVPQLTGNGKRMRDYVHVSDVAKAVKMTFKRLQESCFDEAFNVGSGAETPDDEILQLVQENLRKLKTEPALAAKLANCPDVSGHRSVPALPGEPLRALLNIGKIDAFLGWLPEKNIEDGMRETVRAFVERL